MSRVLVADDDYNIRNLLKQFLSRKGHEVFTSQDGLETLQVVKLVKLDFVLLDIVMPHVDGVRILMELKKLNPEISVIMMTGLLDEEIGKEVLHLGAYDYITKPFDLNYLNTVLETKMLLRNS